MEPMPPMPPPTMPPPWTNGPSLPAMTPAPMANTMPVSFATNVRIVSRPLRRCKRVGQRSKRRQQTPANDVGGIRQDSLQHASARSTRFSCW